MDVKVIRLTDQKPAETVSGKSVDAIAKSVFGRGATVIPCKGHVNPEVTGYSVLKGQAEAGRIFAPKGTPIVAAPEGPAEATDKPKRTRRTREQIEADRAAYDAVPRCICKTSTNLDADNRCPRHPVSGDVPTETEALAAAQQQIDAVKAAKPRRARKTAQPSTRSVEDLLPSL